MKAYLLYPDRDLNLQQPPPWNAQELVQDLELEPLFRAMALEDKFLLEVAWKTILSATENDPRVVLYRQDVLKDCLKNTELVKSVYDIAVTAITNEKKNFFPFFSHYPQGIVDRSIGVMQMFMQELRKLREIADQNIGQFDSEGFLRFFHMLQQELDDAYFQTVQAHLKEMKFRSGVLISVNLGKGNKGTGYTLRKPPENNQRWFERIFTQGPPAYTYTVPDRDENGARALGELKDRGLNLAANALAQSTEHILSFFKMLQTELAFYIGCLNLHDQLVNMGEPICFPVPAQKEDRIHTFRDLHDVSLSLTMKEKVVGNDLDADHKLLIIVTGANQGGKSTFLRSAGIAQLMMQSGMFVAAQSFSANVCDGLFTHYKREEDTTMESGKLDEELSRMSDIVNHITPNALLLFNESLAATNEREGAQIAGQIVQALLEKHIKVFFVSHMFEFARSFYEKRMPTALFLRADRLPNGERTFKIVEGEPLKTSFGVDVYNKVFNEFR